MGCEQAGSAPLARAFRLLDEIVAAGTPLSVAELAERTEIPKPTVHRLVGNMIAEGLLRNDSFSRGLVPGGRVIGMMVKAQAASWPGGPVRAVMQSLVDDVRESCNFGVFDRDAVLYVERVECEWPIRIQLGAGSRVPLHASAIGKLLWAHLPEPDRRHLLATLPRPALTANTVTDASILEAQFDDIRRRATPSMTPRTSMASSVSRCRCGWGAIPSASSAVFRYTRRRLAWTSMVRAPCCRASRMPPGDCLNC